jgi:6-pyruvoyltetrahydropterin/6-carboxytetrahydropterin synthase
VYLVSKEVEFDAGHRVPDHDSKCFNVHGHRYKVRASVAANDLQMEGSSTGMVVDFGDLKAVLQELALAFDHHLLVFDGDPIRADLAALPGARIVLYVPTAENIARAFFEAIKVSDKLTWGTLIEVAVWETPTSVAYYKES